MAPPDTNVPSAAMVEGRRLDPGQLTILVALLGMAALGWWWLISSARSMHASPMDTAGMAGMAPALPALAYLASSFLMWTLMMVAMMLPSAMPMILLYTRLAGRGSPRYSVVHGLVFAGCYLLVWLAFSALAALAQTALVASGAVGQMALSLGSKRLAAGLLAIAGLYQLGPIKRICLDRCRSPLSFVTSLWRPGIAGALRLGLAHGAYCLGCCWLLMLLLFVGGVMNLLWVAALAIVVAVEKWAPPTLQLEKLLAIASLLGAVVLLMQ